MFHVVSKSSSSIWVDPMPRFLQTWKPENQTRANTSGRLARMTCSNDAVQPHPENPRITWRVTRVTVKKTASTKIHQGLPCNDMCGSSAVPPPPNQQITLTHSNSTSYLPQHGLWLHIPLGPSTPKDQSSQSLLRHSSSNTGQAKILFGKHLSSMWFNRVTCDWWGCWKSPRLGENGRKISNAYGSYASELENLIPCELYICECIPVSPNTLTRDPYQQWTDYLTASGTGLGSP